MEKRICVAGDEYTFTMKAPDNFHPPLVATCIKVRNYDALAHLSPGARRRFDTFEGKLRGDLELWAYTAAQRAFWEWASQRARELQLGVVLAAGRSHGWLTVVNFTSQYLDEVAEVIENRCKNCGLSYAEHALGKCLYEPTRFETTAASFQQQLDNIGVLLEEVKQRVTSAAVGRAVAAELEEFIDEQWEEQRALGQRRTQEPDGDRGSACRRADGGDDVDPGERGPVEMSGLRVASSEEEGPVPPLSGLPQGTRVDLA